MTHTLTLTLTLTTTLDIPQPDPNPNDDQGIIFKFLVAKNKLGLNCGGEGGVGGFKRHILGQTPCLLL